MNMPRYHARDLEKLFKKKKIATMEELKGALGTDVQMTVYRKLQELSYHTSYSHGSRYYTLDSIAQFDEQGLWSCRSVWFSRYGTLLATLEAFVAQSEAGYFADELRECLHVGVKESVLKLVNSGSLVREKVGGLYLYCCREPSKRRQQLLTRRASMRAKEAGFGTFFPEEISEEVKAAIVLFVSLLDERQRRLFAGLEALKFGPGGDDQVAQLLGLHRNTVAKGRRQLLQWDVEVEAERVRKVGGGRKPVKKKRQKLSAKSKS